MLEGGGKGGGRGKRQRNPSQRQCRGWERKGERKRPVGIHLLGGMGEGGFLLSPPLLVRCKCLLLICQNSSIFDLRKKLFDSFA